jgi:signal transduction histidine kinase
VHDSNLIALYTFGTIAVAGLIAALIFAFVLYKQRQAKTVQEQKLREHAYNAELLQIKIEVQEATLNTVGMELHDDIAQTLTGHILQLASLARKLPQDGTQTVLENYSQGIRDVISKVRLLSHSLSSAMTENRSVENAVQSELKRISAFSPITCSLLVDTVYEPEPRQRLLLFRVVQEALQNILKHARATTIAVTISQVGHYYQLQIADNGQGFDVTSYEMASTMGLNNMQERMHLMQGNLQIHSVIGKGTILVLQIPTDGHAGEDKSDIGG